MKEFVLEWIISYPASLIFVFIGCWQLYDTLFFTDRKERGTIDPYFEGWVSGAGFLMLGLVITFLKFFNIWH
jgi:hypothetical protein